MSGTVTPGLEPFDHPGDLLSAHLDGELPAELASHVECHVATCSRCRADLDELAAARALLRQLPVVSAPPGFGAALVRSRQQSSRRGVALALVAASVAVVAGLFVADPATPPSGNSPALALTSDSPRFDAGMTATTRPALTTTVPGASPAPTVAAVPAPGRVPPAGAGAVADPSPPPPSLVDRVGDAVTGLLDAIGG
ncbi:MAG TPA: zf-HC2 domain-containing protein [Acidimicrobiales bacterium]|nr:zf-HC2 domain-containing protein [Acidimicrobiales bacterium]